MKDVRLAERCAAVTYNFIMAIAPTMLFLFTLVPYLPIKGVESTMLATIPLIIPNPHLEQSASRIIIDFMHHERRDVLSFGIILVMFFSSNGMMGLMRGFDRSQASYKKRTGLQRRWVAIKLTIIMIIAFLLTIAALIIQTKKINKYLLHFFGNIAAVKICSILIVVIVIFLSISIIYTYGPSLTRRFRFVSAGSVFSTTMIIVITTVFFFLINKLILNYNQIYGSVGTIIAFMAWMWLNVLVILIGYELNVSILLAKLTKKEYKNA